MSTSLRRGLEVISVQTKGSLDGQGRPSFSAAYTLNARVVREDNSVRMPNGETIRTSVTCYISGDQSPLPYNDDKITCADGFIGIVVDRYNGKSLSDVLDHIRIMLREQPG